MSACVYVRVGDFCISIPVGTLLSVIPWPPYNNLNHLTLKLKTLHHELLVSTRII